MRTVSQIDANTALNILDACLAAMDDAASKERGQFCRDWTVRAQMARELLQKYPRPIAA